MRQEHFARIRAPRGVPRYSQKEKFTKEIESVLIVPPGLHFKLTITDSEHLKYVMFPLAIVQLWHKVPRLVYTALMKKLKHENSQVENKGFHSPVH